MYDVYFDKLLLPVAPSKIKLKINNQNKTVNLINEGEINILKKTGLTDITFSVMLPQMQYPFARYKNGFKSANYYLDAMKSLKNDRSDEGNWKPFQLIISRTTPDGKKVLFYTNMTVAIEDYTINEDAKNGLDLLVDMNLKQYRPCATKKIKIKEEEDSKAGEKPKAEIQPQRPAETAPRTRTYTVVKGDTLWAIAKKYYNDGSQYTKIHNANKDKISNPNLIYPGQVLVIP